MDAGVSRRVLVGEPIALVGHVEGAGSGVTLLWTGDAACTITDATLVLATASCSAEGTRVFTFTATEGAATASDTVAIVVVREVTTRIVQQTGTTLVGLPDEWVSTGFVDGQTGRISFQVPPAVQRMRATLSWSDPLAPTAQLNHYVLSLVKGAVFHQSHPRTQINPSPVTVDVAKPAPGPWRAQVEPYAAVASTWQLVVDAVSYQGDSPLPTAANLPTTFALPGETVVLDVAAEGGTPPYAVAWETTPTSRRFDDATGATFSFPFAGTSLVRAKVTDANGFEAIAEAQVRLRSGGTATPRPFTVVAVIDNEFSVYQHDFGGAYHPWNRDADATNDHDFTADPASYLAGHPGATALPITLPRTPDEGIFRLVDRDYHTVWTQFPSSNLATGVHPVWFPGTKIVAAVRFGGAIEQFQSFTDGHGTRFASVAAGNWNGGCAECALVLISGEPKQALRWAAAQPWIDVVLLRDQSLVAPFSVSLGKLPPPPIDPPIDATREATQAGQVVVVQASEDFLGAGASNYASAMKGPDWIVTAGKSTPPSEPRRAGSAPYDLVGIAVQPSSGGTRVNSSATLTGTSAAASVAAGAFAKTIHAAREALGDDTPGHATGVVASGAPLACGSAWTGCPLGDGILTRAELEKLVFHNVLPVARPAVAGAPFPSPDEPFAYVDQGHGALVGRALGAAEHDVEWRRMADAARGLVAPHERPEGEAAWFVADSFCRQKLWGSWSEGAYRGGTPTFDPEREAPAAALFASCTGLPADVLVGIF